MANQDRIDKRAQGNPAQPRGWAVDYPVNPNAYPDDELMEIERQKRLDTAQWEDVQNRSPIDNINPAQPPGFAVPEPTRGPMGYQDGNPPAPMGPTGITARVFAPKVGSTRPEPRNDEIIGSRVLLSNGRVTHLGTVVTVGADSFKVAWNDGRVTTEHKADYELVIRES